MSNWEEDQDPTMPKGWNELYYNQYCVEQKGQRELLKKACELMKEMYEALEVCNEALNRYKDIAEQEAAAVLLSYEVCTKFKEWKSE